MSNTDGLARPGQSLQLRPASMGRQHRYSGSGFLGRIDHPKWNVRLSPLMVLQSRSAFRYHRRPGSLRRYAVQCPTRNCHQPNPVWPRCDELWAARSQPGAWRENFAPQLRAGSRLDDAQPEREEGIHIWAVGGARWRSGRHPRRQRGAGRSRRSLSDRRRSARRPFTRPALHSDDRVVRAEHF